MSNADDNLRSVYDKLCASYHGIDAFRAQLLERLPLAAGAGGIFLLYITTNGGGVPKETKAFLPFIGLFGFVVTLGLYVYEMYGIKKCTALIMTGKELEARLGIEGQFLSRPKSFLNEPFATGLIYPAVLAAWAYLGLAFVDAGNLLWIAVGLAFGLSFVLTMGYNLKLLLDSRPTALSKLNELILRAEEDGNKEAIAAYLHPDFMIVHANGEKQNKEQFLNSIPINQCRGRAASQSEIRMTGLSALYTGIITTTQNPDGTSDTGRFWNTRLFVKENGHWVCQSWQVMKMP